MIPEVRQGADWIAAHAPPSPRVLPEPRPVPVAGPPNTIHPPPPWRPPVLFDQIDPASLEFGDPYDTEAHNWGPLLVSALTPSSDTSGQTDTALIQRALNLGGQVILGTGTWTLSAPLVMGLANTVLQGRGPATVLNAAAGFTGTALIQPGASQQRISNLAANCGAMSFVDFGNTFMNYFEADHLVVTGAAGGTAHMWTGSNLHRSVFRDCLFTQNGTAVSIWAMGAGTGLSTTSFDRIVSIVGCDPTVGTRTAAAWSIQLATNKTVDVVRFAQCFGLVQVTNSQIDATQYFYDIACTANVALNDFDRISFSECDFGNTLGGAIRIQSTAGVYLDKVTCGNVFAQAGKSLTASLIRIQTSGGSGQHCNGVYISNYLREGSAAMGAGVDPSDISISSDTTEVTLTNIAKADSGGGQAVQINLGTPSGAIRALIQSVDATAVILNQNSTAGQATIVMGNGAITLGGTAYTNP